MAKKKGLILMKSSVCILSWLPLGYVLNCEKEKKKSYPQPIENGSVLCVCFVSGAKNDNLPTVPFLELVPLWKVTVNALLVSHPWSSGSHRHAEAKKV